MSSRLDSFKAHYDMFIVYYYNLMSNSYSIFLRLWVPILIPKAI